MPRQVIVEKIYPLADGSFLLGCRFAEFTIVDSGCVVVPLDSEQSYPVGKHLWAEQVSRWEWREVAAPKNGA